MLKDMLTLFISQVISYARQLFFDFTGLNFPRRTQRVKVRAIRYKVVVDDNYNYMDEDARWEKGTYATQEKALTVCRRIVDDWLQEGRRPGMSAQDLYDAYVMYGVDPFIVVEDGTDESAKFSAWDYAKERSHELCGDN